MPPPPLAASLRRYYFRGGYDHGAAFRRHAAFADTPCYFSLYAFSPRLRCFSLVALRLIIFAALRYAFHVFAAMPRHYAGAGVVTTCRLSFSEPRRRFD